MRILLRWVLRAAVSSFQAGRRAVWFVTRPEVRGADAVALTPRGTIVLVRPTYRRGWVLPGGCLKPGEGAEAAVLRELGEEIGLLRHASFERAGTLRHRSDFRRASSDVFVLRGVEYRPPAWSFEVEEVREFPPGALPPDLTPAARAMLEIAGFGAGDRAG